MAYLKNLSVDKIDFVNKAANKRTFLLLKSEDAVKTKQEGEYKPMRKELKTALVSVIKSKSLVDLPSTEDVTKVLKADTELKLTEAEVTEVSEYLEVVRQAATMTPEEKKKMEEKMAKEKEKEKEKGMQKGDEENIEKAEKAALLLKIDTLSKSLADMNTTTIKRDYISRLEKECPFLLDDIAKTVNTIMKLHSVDPAIAEEHISTLKKTSAVVEQSRLFVENGTTLDTITKSDSDEFDIVKKVSAAFDGLLQKSDGKPLTSDSISKIIRQQGPAAYDQYRYDHIIRAKTRGI